MINLSSLQKLGIEFRYRTTDEDSINEVTELIISNQNDIKSLIIINIAINEVKSLIKFKNLSELWLTLVCNLIFKLIYKFLCCQTNHTLEDWLSISSSFKLLKNVNLDLR